MATVHPSRMGLVPASAPPKDAYPERRGRSPSPTSSRRKDYDRSRERDRDYRRDHRSGERDRRNGDRDGDRGDRRRASPDYQDYSRPPPPPRESAAAPWRQEENMYPNRREGGGRDRPREGYGGGGGGGGSDFMESRRLQRESMTVDIWPPSPKAPSRALSPARGSKSHKKKKRARSASSSDISSSDDDRHRRKEKKKARKERDREGRRDKKEHRRHKHRHDDDSEDEKDRGRSRKSRSKSKGKEVRKRSASRSPTKSPSRPAHADEEDEWVEKPSTAIAPVPASSAKDDSALMPPPRNPPAGDDDSDEEVGPQPLHKISKKTDERAYGGALLRGEGSAMAAFLQDGTDSRIPRRGEIGLTSDEIATYEAVGYVMSGSRHRRMNAVRMRKENQVISAEEKRGILKLQKEERERREAILREEFSELVSERLKGTEPKGQ